MKNSPPFERSVFINAPFDDAFAPILQAIAFTVADLGYFPRLAPENSDNGTNRLERIFTLIRGSRFGIHDLSRCRAGAPGEYFRLNMPFELGLDHGAARLSSDALATKRVLVLEQNRYDYQRSLSDIAGWDIEAHSGDWAVAITKVRGWLVRQGTVTPVGPSKIRGDYADFQEWYWERELDSGASEDDIRDYPTIDVVRAMSEWVSRGQPL